VKKIKMGEYLAKLQPRTRLSRALSSCLAVCWPAAQSARDNHGCASTFAKYSPIKKNSLADSAINLS